MIIEKTCSRCGETLPVANFHKDKSTKTGYSSYCKTCKSLADSKDREKHIEKRKSAGKRWRENNVEYKRAKAKEYRLNNLEYIRAKDREYSIANAEKVRQRSVIWRRENKERFTSTVNKWRSQNKARTKEIRRRWLDKNPEYPAFKTANYRASKLRATPFWLAGEHYDEISEMYAVAKMFQVYTGQEYHVDHIVPLQGETVCGLHVPWNLQILLGAENQSKSNKYWPDMPE